MRTPKAPVFHAYFRQLMRGNAPAKRAIESRQAQLRGRGAFHLRRARNIGFCSKAGMRTNATFAFVSRKRTREVQAPSTEAAIKGVNG
jgi:hypothetical protein